LLPNTNAVVNGLTIGLDVKFLDYFTSGFLSLRIAVDNWVFSYLKAEEQCGPLPLVVFTPFPTYAYSQNPFYLQVGFLLGLAMTSTL
jgi:hypothetical protein